MRIAIVALVVLLGACSSKRDRESPLVEVAKRFHPGDAELTRAIPIYPVSQLRASEAYYRDKLGFKVDWDYGDPPDFGSVSRGDLVVFLAESRQTTDTWSMAFAKDLDALHADFVRRGAIIKMPPTDMPWGLREMHVADPDGNVIRFGAAQH